MRKLFVCLLSLLIVFAGSLSYASVGVKYNGVSVGGATDLDFAQGMAQTTDGSTWHIGNSISAEITTAVTTIPVTYAIVPILISGRTCTLAAGQPGQIVTIIGVDRVSGTLTISPAGGSIGWTSATMATNGYSLTLMYMSTAATGGSPGWVVVHYYGTTVS